MRDLLWEEQFISHIRFAASISLVVFFASCTTVFTEADNSFDIPRISAAKKSNGFVVTISATRKIGKVEAWIGNDNWLYITIPDTSVNLAELNSLQKNPLFERTECFKMHEVIQLSLQMREKVDQLDVVRYPDNNDVYIALYDFGT